MKFTLSNIHYCLYFVIYTLAILDFIFNLKYGCLQISLLLHKPVYTVYTVWTSVTKMLALALVLPTTSQHLVPSTARNRQIHKHTWPNKRQMGGSHHRHDAPTHSRARAPPTTPKTAPCSARATFFLQDFIEPWGSVLWPAATNSNEDEKNAKSEAQRCAVWCSGAPPA